MKLLKSLLFQVTSLTSAGKITSRCANHVVFSKPVERQASLMVPLVCRDDDDNVQIPASSIWTPVPQRTRGQTLANSFSLPECHTNFERSCHYSCMARINHKRGAHDVCISACCLPTHLSVWNSWWNSWRTIWSPSWAWSDGAPGGPASPLVKWESERTPV